MKLASGPAETGSCKCELAAILPQEVAGDSVSGPWTHSLDAGTTRLTCKAVIIHVQTSLTGAQASQAEDLIVLIRRIPHLKGHWEDGGEVMGSYRTILDWSLLLHAARILAGFVSVVRKKAMSRCHSWTPTWATEDAFCDCAKPHATTEANRPPLPAGGACRPGEL